MSPIWLVRMAKWARHPPGKRRVAIVLTVLILCLALAGLEAFGLWPDWASAKKLKLRP